MISCGGISFSLCGSRSCSARSASSRSIGWPVSSDHATTRTQRALELADVLVELRGDELDDLVRDHDAVRARP